MTALFLILVLGAVLWQLSPLAALILTGISLVYLAAYALVGFLLALADIVTGARDE